MLKSIAVVVGSYLLSVVLVLATYWLSWLLTWPVSCWIGLLLSGRRADVPSA
jgi:hypothetical protein